MALAADLVRSRHVLRTLQLSAKMSNGVLWWRSCPL
jgi:hypothetical protein